MKDSFEEAVTSGIENISNLMFSELMLLIVINALGSIAICLMLWPQLMLVFLLESVFAIVTVIITRQVIWRTMNQIDSISDGLRQFSEDTSFRFDAKEGSLEDSLNMWMDAVTVATDVSGDFEAIDDDARRIGLIADGMLSNIVPRDADMILEVRSSATHIQSVISSREQA